MPTPGFRPRTARRRSIVLAITTLALLLPATASAQWVRQHEQFYLPAQHNWQFRQNYQAADRLFNAFDYGHAILYEVLYTRPGSARSVLEEREYDFITKRLLVSPPRLPVEEAAVEVHYARLVPEAKLMFEWAHVLHRVLYDIWADDRLDLAAKDAAVAEALRYYRSRPDLAFSTRPKSMELMEGQPYSLAFRREYPKFNGLIWAYHWLQVGLYDALIAGADAEARQQNVNAAVARFWQMLNEPPTSMPRVMPMTPAVAPRFTARYPEAAIIFDNLHSMHDVISDVLASTDVPRDRKRAEILLAAARYRDDTSFVMPREEWIAMSNMMGAANMGGVADPELLGALPEPTLPVGATHAQAMEHQDHAEHRQPAAAPQHQHGPAQPAQPAQPEQPHAIHADSSMHAPHADSSMHAMHMRQSLAFHLRLLSDSVIRERILADTLLRRMMEEMIDHLPAEHRAHVRGLLAPASPHRHEPHAGHPR